jgi:hypothetical protein
MSNEELALTKGGSAFIQRGKNFEGYDKLFVTAPPAQKTTRELVSVYMVMQHGVGPKKLTVTCRLKAALQRILLLQKRFSATPTH